VIKKSLTAVPANKKQSINLTSDVKKRQSDTTNTGGGEESSIVDVED